MEQFVYFGHDTFDASMNMAIDDVLRNMSAQRSQCFVRFYDFERPALILALVEHPSDIIAANGYDITRRTSNGSVILCDERTLSYSIIVPRGIYNITTMHSKFGARIGKSLKEYINHDAISIGEHFSVRIDGRTIAGHGQYAGHSMLYHGILALQPWDMKKIAESIRLRNGEYEFIQSLPSVADYVEGMDKHALVSKLLAGITDEKYETISPELRNDIIRNASQIAPFYRSEDWIQFGPYHDRPDARHLLERRSGLGFCFADFLTPEQEKTNI